MEEKAKVTVDLSNCSDADAISKTETAIEKLTENVAIYASPIVPVATMKSDKDDLVNKVAQAQYGGVDETLAKNLAREIVNSNYRVNGNYVNSVANGDKTKALASGYELVKPRTKPVLEDFELVNQKINGSILVYCRQKPHGLIVKILQYSYEPQLETSWKSGGVTRKIKKIIKNLESGRRVWVRLAVVVDEDVITYCDPISIIVT